MFSPPLVRDPAGGKSVRKRLTPEMRVALGARIPANVDQELDSCTGQDCQELLNRPGAVADGEDGLQIVRSQVEVYLFLSAGTAFELLKRMVRIPYAATRAHTTSSNRKPQSRSSAARTARRPDPAKFGTR